VAIIKTVFNEGIGLAPVPTPPTEPAITPSEGPLAGGTEVTIVTTAADMAGCSDDFSDGVIGSLWSDISSGSGSAVEQSLDQQIVLDTGLTPGSVAGLRTVARPLNVDVEATFVKLPTTTIAPLETSEVTIAKLALVVDDTPGQETDFVIRVETNRTVRTFHLQIRQNGQYMADQSLIIGQSFPDDATSVVLRLLRAGSRVVVFRNRSLLLTADWIPTSAQVEMSVANDAVDVSQAIVAVRSYKRLPVVEFGTEPMVTTTFQRATRIVGQTPPAQRCADPAVVDVRVTGCGNTQATKQDGFTFTLNSELIRFLDGPQAQPRELTVCNDIRLRRRR
jgi:hypothetical protein